MGNNGVRNKTLVRKKVKVAFVKHFSHLFKEAGSHVADGHLTEAGRKAVECARRHIGYSPSYTNMDLYRNLYLLHKDVNQ